MPTLFEAEHRHRHGRRSRKVLVVRRLQRPFYGPWMSTVRGHPGCGASSSCQTTWSRSSSGTNTQQPLLLRLNWLELPLPQPSLPLARLIPLLYCKLRALFGYIFVLGFTEPTLCVTEDFFLHLPARA